MQDSLPAGWLAFTGRELNPLDRDERFPSCYISSPFPGFILTLRNRTHNPDISAMRGPPLRECVALADLGARRKLHLKGCTFAGR